LAVPFTEAFTVNVGVAVNVDVVELEVCHEEAAEVNDAMALALALALALGEFDGSIE
jgi:hypothetical protein